MSGVRQLAITGNATAWSSLGTISVTSMPNPKCVICSRDVTLYYGCPVINSALPRYTDQAGPALRWR